VAPSEGLLGHLAGAILDGGDIDWASAASTADESQRPVLDQLRLLAAVADLHRVAKPEYWGHLRVLERIGRGAFGEVYRAWDTRLDREVALKLLPADASKHEPHDASSDANSIIHEGRLLARVRHANVVTIYGAERLEGRIGLWMEFVRGRTLEQILEGGKIFSVAETVAIGIELCEAIAAVHGAGLLHRDVKAHNVMLAQDGRVVLMDFGTGRELADRSGGSLAGTPLYLAPEVLRGAPASVASDVYSVGVLLHHLLTGSYPVRGRGLRDLRLAHERHERTELAVARPDLPPKLAAVIARAIEPDPKRRYESASALAADLAALKPRWDLAGTPARSVQDPRSGRALWSWRLAAVVGVILIALIAWVGRRSNVATGSTTATLAVLPFDELNRNGGDEHLGLGLADALTARLSNLRQVVVRPTSTVRELGGAREPVAAGRSLHVQFVVDGTIRRSGDRIRVTVQLVDVERGAPRWAETFDERFTEILSVEDSISRKVVGALALQLGGDDLSRLAQRGTEDPEAHVLYFKGRYFWNKRKTPNLKMAISYFQAAIDRDPSYAEAFAGLADAYALLATADPEALPPRDTMPRARAAAEAALRLDEHLAEAHASLGYVAANYEWDWATAEREFKRAIDLNPNYATARHWYFWYLITMGRLDEAEEQITRARELDPLSPMINTTVGVPSYYARQYDRALARFQRAAEVGPDFWLTHIWLGWTYSEIGRYSEAVAEFQREQDPGALKYGGLGYAYARAGDHGAAREVLAEALKKTERQYLSSHAIAIIYAALGEKDQAFRWLERALSERDEEMTIIKVDPRLDTLRTDVRFDRLVERVMAGGPRRLEPARPF
jgi:TolB-like protein/tetratricopeptide (TPR) repeat protein/tRNA A-37 threonylcarbamoyl transferase component Bud32